jgi:hypothetical protein
MGKGGRNDPMYEHMNKINFFLKNRTEKLIFNKVFMAVNLLFFYSFIQMCIYCLGHFTPLSPDPTLSHPPLLSSSQNLSTLISNFVEE